MNNGPPRRPPTPTAPEPAVVEVTVDRLAWGGDGVGRVDGKVVFIAGAAPGDRLLASIVPGRRSWSRGEIVEILHPGPGRTAPPCPLAGNCGGCQWLHVTADTQRAEKAAVLRETLRRIGGLEAPPASEMAPSPRDLGYRHRARLHCDLRGGNVRLGFYRSGSRRIAPLEKCPILTPSLNAVTGLLLRVLRESWKPEALRTADLASDFDDVTVRLSLEGPKGLLVPPRPVGRLLRGQADEQGIDLILPGMKDRPLAMTGDDDGPRAMRSSFTQVNLHLNVRLVAEVAALAAGGKVLDLFCGAGNFSIPLARSGAEVLGVDSSGPAVASAVANARRAGAGRTTFRRGQAERILNEMRGAGRPFDTVVVNPPRRGCREAVPGIIALSPARVVVVSCDPATFARDAAAIVAGGYELAHLRIFDLFPQTYHFETVALFTR